MPAQPDGDEGKALVQWIWIFLLVEEFRMRSENLFFFYGGERILGVILGYCKDYCRLYIYKRRRDFLLTQEVAGERVKPEQKGGC